jgi:hypothetical protein
LVFWGLQLKGGNKGVPKDKEAPGIFGAALLACAKALRRANERKNVGKVGYRWESPVLQCEGGYNRKATIC